MFNNLFLIDLEYNANNKLVSLTTGIIFVIALLTLNELLYWDMEILALIATSTLFALTGFVFAERFPLIAKSIPLAVTVFTVSGLIYSAIDYKVQKHQIAETSKAFFEQTNNCEGFALVNREFAPSCVKLNSTTINNWCSHKVANEWNCRLVKDIDIVSSPSFLTNKS